MVYVFCINFISHNNLSFAFIPTAFSARPEPPLVLLLLERVLHLLRVGGGRGQGGLVQVLGDLAELLEHLSALALQLLTELLGLGHDGAHLGLELFLVLLGVGHQLGVLSLNVADGVCDLSLDLLNHTVEGSRILLCLLSQVSDDSLQLGGISPRLGVDQVDQLSVVLDAPHLEEGVVHLAEGILKSSEEGGQRGGGRRRGITNDAASGSLEVDKNTVG